MESNWVDFKAVKQSVTMEQILGRYGVKLKKSGKELRGKCPIHQGEGTDTFHANREKNIFHCFSCKARGNVLDFVAAMEKCSVRDAGLKLQEWFSLSVGESGAATKAAASTGGKKTAPEKQAPINPPLGFQLRV